MIILKLLKRICIHKFWVAYYCFQLGLYKQGILHDMSKFSYTELKGAIKYWNPKISSLTNELKIKGYSATFLHHRGRNPHHYEYWIHSLDIEGIPAEMPRKYVLELICDYLAACKTYGGDPKTEYNWWIKRKDSLKDKYVAYDQQDGIQEMKGCLKPVFVNGKLVRDYSISEIRERINSTLV